MRLEEYLGREAATYIATRLKEGTDYVLQAIDSEECLFSHDIPNFPRGLDNPREAWDLGKMLLSLGVLRRNEPAFYAQVSADLKADGISADKDWEEIERRCLRYITPSSGP